MYTHNNQTHVQWYNYKPSTFLFVQAEMLVELTRNETVFGWLEIALTVELVEQELMNATGNLTVCRQQHPLPFLFCVTIRTCHAILPTENGGACEMYNLDRIQCTHILNRLTAVRTTF